MQSEVEQAISVKASISLCEARTAELKLEPPVPADVSPLYPYWHRAMDVSFGLISIVFLFLILPILAFLLYLDSPGPIFYTQERVGYRGRKFTMYKFRSMRTDAEQVGHPVWTTEGDTRVTRIGRFLRATHLDELPQVFNILSGEMSLIGPRPEREEYVAELEQANPLYRYRLTVKPGLTGWAQVKYGYGRTVEEEQIKLHYDLYYIEHQSCALDMRILLKTILEVLLYHGK